ncbi:hypothetical protein LRS10_08970 [Phenylobacterium sp. J426]|uniref:hypothetical protein n=1 Tax=Phenylobacterium sp. J426 TaxID=2898439 RepID=UPI0021508639|nr:hypothetical protein [Phenylobacterium sp. J426]MCR5874284.1 hypothetical protein [Phenylobacterium sp. J426]
MRRHALVLGLAFLGLAIVAVAAGWGFYQVSLPTDGGRSLGPLWPYLLGAGALLAVLIAVLAGLAFYAGRHGWKERTDAPPPRPRYRRRASRE